MTKLSGLLREVQHCTDEHAGDPGYDDRLGAAIADARSLVLRSDRLLGEDVIAAVQRETDLARVAFGRGLGDDAGPQPQPQRDLHAARNLRVTLLDRLGTRVEFPPAPGTLLKRAP